MNNNYNEMAKRYGKTTYKGNTYALIEEAKFDGIQNIRIDNSINKLSDNHVSADCIDIDGNEYIAYFAVKDDTAEMDSPNFADYVNATYIVSAQ